MMKILFFEFVFHFGGGPQLAADTVTRLARLKGVNIDVLDAYGICKPYHDKLKQAGIKTHVLIPNPSQVWIGYYNNRFIRTMRMLCQTPMFWRLRQRLIRKIREINPDVIWSNSPKGTLFLGTALGLYKYPLAREYIGCPPASSIPWYDRCILKNRIDTVMAISTETSRQLQIAGVSKEKIKVVYDTIDMADTLRRSEGPLDAPLPGMDKRPHILVAGTLLPKKGQDTAVKAIGRLKKQGYDPVLWIAGDIVGNDQSYLCHLKKLVNDLNIIDNVYFLGWRYDIPAIMKQMDILVHPTHEEGFGHVILEGMLLHRPVIATPVGGIKDSIENGQNGLFFPVGDDAKLAENIRYVIDNANLASVMADMGYTTVISRFSPENHTRRVIESLVWAVEEKRRKQNNHTYKQIDPKGNPPL